MAKEYVEGVIMGSIAKVERRTRGVEADIRVGRQAWRRVAGRRLVGTDIEGRRDREGRMVRGGAEVGVTIRRVRMRSRGARDIAATAAAATATAKDSSGEGESIMSRPPMPDAEVPMRPESGMLRSAESMLRVHDSVVRRRKLYTNVTFVPFQTPQADSFCHNCPMTSSRASGFRSSSLRGAGEGA